MRFRLIWILSLLLLAGCGKEEQKPWIDEQSYALMARCGSWPGAPKPLPSIDAAKVIAEEVGVYESPYVFMFDSCIDSRAAIRDTWVRYVPFPARWQIGEWFRLEGELDVFCLALLKGEVAA